MPNKWQETRNTIGEKGFQTRVQAKKKIKTLKYRDSE